MTLKRATWILLAGLALWACGGNDGGSTTDTQDPDTASEVGPDGTAEETGEETSPDVSEPEPDVSEPDVAEPDLTEPEPDVAEEATEVTETVEETTEVTETVEETTEVTETAEETEVVDPESEFSKLIAHVEAADYVNTKLPNVVAATDVSVAGLDTYVILDVRMKDRYGPDANGVWQKTANGTADFEDGHIEGAINVAWNKVVEYAETNLTKDHKILVVCYTGQDAGHAVLALSLLGYDAYSLKWGMSGWHQVFDLWSGAIGDTWAGQFTTDPDTGKNAAGDYPDLDTGMETAEEILRARIDVLQATETTRIIDATTVFASPESFYIVNYWPEAEYLNPGHIVGSHQYTPKASLKSMADLATLPTDQKIAVYCYSGQQSSQLAAFLTVLGYDAYSVKFGTNAMIYSQMTKQQWTVPGDFAYVGAPPVLPSEFSKLIAHVEAADYMNTAFPKVVAATDVAAAGLDTYTVIDIRTKDKYGPDGSDVWQMAANGTPDFDDGHLEGALNMAWNEVVAYVQANLTKDDKILVVCYTGQEAGHPVMALNLLGYNAYSLKWGMSGWNADFDLWTAATGDTWAGQFTTDADTGKNAAGDYPLLETGEATAEEILMARIDALNGGASTRIIEASALFAAPEDFYVVNYWAEAEYLNPGHITGAHQYTPKASLKTAAFLATLPTDQKIAVYCYTGQQSSQVAAFLTVLGYDAYSIKNGTNGMIYSQMTQQKWTTPGDYAYVQ
jgi:rhodanese-related sulfurtransferase